MTTWTISYHRRMTRRRGQCYVYDDRGRLRTTTEDVMAALLTCYHGCADQIRIEGEKFAYLLRPLELRPTTGSDADLLGEISIGPTADEQN